MRPFKAFVSAIRGQLNDDAFRATLVLLVGLLLAGTLVYPVLEGWSLVDALYFSVVTLATVGYGDIHPVTDMGKLFTVLYILTGVGVLVVFASRVVNVMVSQRSERARSREERLHEDEQRVRQLTHQEPAPTGSAEGRPDEPPSA